MSWGHLSISAISQLFLARFGSNFLKGSWEHIQQIRTVITTFVQATFVLGTFVHISNISAFQSEHFRLKSCHILLSNCSLSPSIKTKSGLYLIPVRTRRTRGTSRSFFAQRKVFKQRHIFYPRFMDNISSDNKFIGLKVKHVSSLHQSNHVKTNQTFFMPMT